MEVKSSPTSKASKLPWCTGAQLSDSCACKCASANELRNATDRYTYHFCKSSEKGEILLEDAKQTNMSEYKMMIHELAWYGRLAARPIQVFVASVLCSTKHNHTSGSIHGDSQILHTNSFCNKADQQTHTYTHRDTHTNTHTTQNTLTSGARKPFSSSSLSLSTASGSGLVSRRYALLIAWNLAVACSSSGFLSGCLLRQGECD